ncbi:hypothetical protein ACT17_15310 [Mycolicibacterium conceptionense]|uniref:Uncharacterized protein n=1 Tax=Mycolicibacterium conceptionense TaxID=451644 RepID=A0A0J8U7Y4_9MYCO|nr:hypothetical protein [Mycolicibacterium conceptionense]KMV17643.1 hypothetical protein ACT17_15310 [Mycolicibacterium conceptionense]
MSADRSELARLMKAIEHTVAQSSSLPPTSRKQRRAAARTALNQARAEMRADERQQAERSQRATPPSPTGAALYRRNRQN